MNHISEEDLIDYYYAEAESPAAISDHLEACSECAQSYEQMVRDLQAINAVPVPQRDAEYAEGIWRSIRGSVPAYEKPRKRSGWNWLSLNWTFAAVATACLLLVAAFFAGRNWEHRNGTTVANLSNGEQGRQRVVLLVLGDHLDRSERLLVELKHAEPSTEAPLQAEARDLLSANRLYRESVKEQDPALASALDHLERVLIEVSNEPAGLSQAKLDELQKEMNTDGLLFEVRVLRSRVQEDANQKRGSADARKGVSIL
ncbi:MAG TPA: hypothetical protein VFS41_07545 [Edaphobacter sp.]|nr:hypothetical protein [Edaphobacter sp.]